MQLIFFEKFFLNRLSPGDSSPFFIFAFMKKLKKLALYLFAAFVFIYLLLALLAGMFEEQIGRSLQAQINNQLKTELQFDDFGLSLLSSFPRLSANFENVRIEDAFGDILLEAQSLSFLINPFSLLGKSVKVNSINLTDGALRIHYDRKGNANYNIFRENNASATSATESDGAGLSIQKARLRDVQLIYQDEVANTEMQIQLLKADLSGNFSAEEIALDTDIALKTELLDVEDERFLSGRNIHIKGKSVLRLNENDYAFENLLLTLEDNDFVLNGSIAIQNTFSDYDLRIEAKDGQLEGLFLFLPENAFPALESIKSRGKFHFSASIKGRKTASSDPAIIANFGLSNGRISSSFLADDLKEVSFTGSFDNGKAHTAVSSSLRINDFSAYLGREYLRGDFSYSNLNRPYVNLSLDGTLPLQALYPAFGESHISAGMGDITFENIRIEGRLRDMRSPQRIDRVKASGQILLDDAGLVINDQKIFFDRGNLKLQGNELFMTDVEIEAPGNEWALEGTFTNLLPALLAPPGNPHNAYLKFSATLQADKLDLDQLLSLTATSDTKEYTGQNDGLSANETQTDSLSSRGTSSQTSLFSLLDGSFRANIEAFNYQKIEAQNFNGQLQCFAGNVKVKGSVQAMEGRFELDGTYFNTQEPYFKGRLTTKEVNVKEFFRQNENFGQEVLQDRHLSGKMQAYISFTVPFDTNGKLLEEKLYVLAAVGLQEGELRDFEMLESFSTFVKIDDLRRIRFHNLYNYFEIRNRTIYIPAMFIQSNAMNMTISGEYDFDYNYAFFIKVNAAQTLANRFKKHDPSLSPIPAKQKGWFNLYYKVTGDLNDYRYKAAKREVRQALAQSQHLKRLLKSRLRREFGDQLDLLVEPEGWQDAEEVNPEAFPLSPEEEEEDFFDWEEEGGGNG